MDSSGRVTIIGTEFLFDASGPVQINGTALLKSFKPSEIQLRFEVDPESPLIKFQGESDES